ncbi:hypothetical protein [Labrys neptuniae]
MTVETAAAPVGATTSKASPDAKALNEALEKLEISDRARSMMISYFAANPQALKPLLTRH